jgi:hypothetical protein
MTKQKKSLHDVIEAKARTDGRYAIAHALMAQADELAELRGAVRGIADMIEVLGHVIRRMRPVSTPESGAK